MVVVKVLTMMLKLTDGTKYFNKGQKVWVCEKLTETSVVITGKRFGKGDYIREIFDWTNGEKRPPFKYIRVDACFAKACNLLLL